MVLCGFFWMMPHMAGNIAEPRFPQTQNSKTGYVKMGIKRNIDAETGDLENLYKIYAKFGHFLKTLLIIFTIANSFCLQT